MNTLKSATLVIALFLIGNTAKAQYGFGTNSPDANSVLHLYSQDSAKGLVIPVVTTAKRPAAATALNGMIVYNITDSCMQFCNGAKWICLDSVGSGGAGVSEWEKGSLHGDADTVIYAARAKNDSGKNVRVYSSGNFDVDGHYMKDGVTILTDQPNNVVATNYNLAVGYGALGNLTTGAQNTATGYQALYSNTTGSKNTAVGYNALDSNVGGIENTASGYNALKANATGSYNTAYGTGSLYKNKTGNNNTGVGPFSLNSNTAGHNNVSLGLNSLYNNTTGSSNVAIGMNTLYNNTTGNSTTAIGPSALFSNTTGARNVAVGSSALNSNTTGGSNSAIGYYALRLNTTGVSNSVVGAEALRYSTTGSYNVAHGTRALYLNTTGGGNVAIGASALKDNTTGSQNVAIGYSALDENLTGGYNVSIGTSSLSSNLSGIYNIASGWASLLSNINGNNNVAIGNESLYYNVHTSNNTALGYRAFHDFISDVGGALNFNPADININTENVYFPTHGFVIGEAYKFRFTTAGTAPGGISNSQIYYFTPTHVDSIQYSNNFTSQGTGVQTITPNLTRDITNATLLGANAQPTKSNQVTLGNTLVTEVRTYGSLIPGGDDTQDIGSATERWRDIYAGNAVINTSDKRLKTNITPLSYGLNELMKLQPVSYQWKKNKNGTRLGFIAQDLQKLLPEVVNEADNKVKTLGVRYTEIIPVLTKAIQEQQGVIKEQQVMIELQNERLEKLEKIVETLLEK